MNCDQIYIDAGQATGKTPSQLRSMAETVFASMLHHVMQQPGKSIWTVACLYDGSRGKTLFVEVDLPRVREGGAKC